MMRWFAVVTVLALGYFSIAAEGAAAGESSVIQCRAEDTLTAVEMDCGDVLEFTLRCGQTRTMALEETGVEVLLTNLPTPKKGFAGGGTVYAFTCRVRIDGQPMTMRRIVPVQQSFYEPYVVDGMRIWFDGVRKIGELFNENHGECVPARDARFAVQDATLPICPQELRPWYPNRQNALDVYECYNGDDAWMGTYFGADLHGGLDVNMPIGTPLWAPIDFDDQFYFNSLTRGDNNNRWRGLRRWPNGDQWTLQTHHITTLLVPEHTPVRQGTHYAVAAGVLTGSHAHSHFVFKVGEEGEQILLDPWILFWQIFENNRDRSGAIRARMVPLGPAETGKPVALDGSDSRPGVTGVGLSHYWAFGDGGFAVGPKPAHTFVRPGIYPVTLVVDDGAERASFTQHVTVRGPPVDKPALVLAAPEEIAFLRRPVDVTDGYGRPVALVPHTLRFLARPSSRPRPAPKTIALENAGGGTLSEAAVQVQYREGEGWLKVTRDGKGNSQTLEVSVDASRLKPKHGIYHALVTVDRPGAINSPQPFRVQLTTPRDRPQSEAIVDDGDAACWATPGAWFAPRFHGPWCQGYGGSYFTCGTRLEGDHFVRYRPDLAAGTYRVSFAEETPFRPSKVLPGDIRFTVRVRDNSGTHTVPVEPLKSRQIGTFDFAEGTDGYLDILTDNAHGIVVADALRFRRVPAPK